MLQVTEAVGLVGVKPRERIEPMRRATLPQIIIENITDAIPAPHTNDKSELTPDTILPMLYRPAAFSLLYLVAIIAACVLIAHRQ
jgi:hypothetical protein